MLKLVIPQTGFKLKTEPDRIIITLGDSNEKPDRALERVEVARRLGKSLRMVDMYRELKGEARLRSERYQNRVVVRESELERWINFIQSQDDTTLYNGRIGGFRPRKSGRHRMEGRPRKFSGLTLT